MRRFLDYLPPIVLPSLMFYFFFWRPFRRVRAARSWRSTRCVIVSCSITEDTTESGSYQVGLAYQYEFAGQRYLASRYRFSLASSTVGYFGRKKVVRRFAPGTVTSCYVDPANPGDAVLDRGVTWDMVFMAAFSVLFLGVFLFFFNHWVV